jgi:hypothetical protein
MLQRAGIVGHSIAARAKFTRSQVNSARIIGPKSVNGLRSAAANCSEQEGDGDAGWTHQFD